MIFGRSLFHQGAGFFRTRGNTDKPSKFSEGKQQWPRKNAVRSVATAPFHRLLDLGPGDRFEKSGSARLSAVDRKGRLLQPVQFKLLHARFQMLSDPFRGKPVQQSWLAGSVVENLDQFEAFLLPGPVV